MRKIGDHYLDYSKIFGLGPVTCGTNRPMIRVHLQGNAVDVQFRDRAEADAAHAKLVKALVK